MKIASVVFQKILSNKKSTQEKAHECFRMTNDFTEHFTMNLE